MASRFVVPDRDQSFLQVVSYREVLGGDHPVWTVIEVVERLDLSLLYARYRPDAGRGGRPALDPAMLLSLLIWGYCEGKRSSRELEEACRRDWAYRAVCGDVVPDHATIARFRQDLDDVIGALFARVLAIVAEAGLGRVGMVALDGTRMEGAASKEANRTAETLVRMEAEARRMLAEADAADRSDDASNGGDGGRVSSRRRRETEAGRRLERIEQAQQVVAEAQERREAEEKKRGKPKRPVSNVTDPQSRLQRTRNGFIQGYNAQAVVSADQVVVAAEVTPDPTDVQMLGPMLAKAQENLMTAGVSEPIAVALADAGYWSEDNARFPQPHVGTCLLIATTKSHKVGVGEPDPHVTARDHTRQQVIARIDGGEITVADAAAELGLSGSWVSQLRTRYRHHDTLASTATIARQAMEAKLAEPEMRDLYRQRGWLIEGSFAHTKHHRATRRFSRRGLAACDAEWKLINLAGNILKYHRYRTAPGPDTPETGPPGALHRLLAALRPHPSATCRRPPPRPRRRTSTRPHTPTTR